MLAAEPEQLLRYRFAARTLDTIVAWLLAAEGAGTRLTLTHEGFNLDSPLSRRAFEGMRPGRPAVLARLESVLGGARA